MIKFQKFYVTDGTNKARVSYSLDNRIDKKSCVTIYAKDYCNNLREIIPDGYENNSDIMTDYFERGCVRLFADHPLYAAARQRAEVMVAASRARYEANLKKWAAS